MGIDKSVAKPAGGKRLIHSQAKREGCENCVDGQSLQSLGE